MYTHIDGWLAFDKAQMKANPFKNASGHWCIGRISICWLQSCLADFLQKQSPSFGSISFVRMWRNVFFHNKNFTLREGMILNHQQNSPLKSLNTTTRGTSESLTGTVARGENPPRTLTALPVLILTPSTWDVFCLVSIYLPRTKSLPVVAEVYGQWWKLIPSMDRGPRASS